MKSINPYTQEVVFENQELSDKQVTEAIEIADKAFKKWKSIDLSFRIKKMSSLAEVLERNKKKYAKVITLEMGKPIKQSIAEVEKCAWVCRYYSENAEEQLAIKKIETNATSSYVRYDPLGVILGVMPWNFPFWQVFRFAVPTILAGNTALLKHASNVMESSKMIQDAFEEADFDKGIFTSLLISSKKVEKVIRHKAVQGTSLTGSKPAGSAVASVSAEEIKPSLLELGGNNALVVFADCDMEETLETCIQARYQNTGQSCIAGKRLFLNEKIEKEFLSKLTAKIKDLKSGDPLDEDTFIGPMVSTDAAITLEEQLNKSVAKGAKIVVGGNRSNAYFEPTLVTNVSEEMPIYQEETFGPLLACSTFSTDEEVIKMINSSDFGLGASLFTKDKARLEKLIPQIEDGAVFVNELVKSDPRLPFGGTKISGYGRELSETGIKSFVNRKTVFIKE